MILVGDRVFFVDLWGKWYFVKVEDKEFYIDFGILNLGEFIGKFYGVKI